VVYFYVLFVENCDILGRKEIENREGVWLSSVNKPNNTPWFSSLVRCHDAVLEKSPRRECQVCGEVGQWTASTKKCCEFYRNESSLFLQWKGILLHGSQTRFLEKC